MARRTISTKARNGGRALFYLSLAAMMLEAAPALPARDAAATPRPRASAPVVAPAPAKAPPSLARKPAKAGPPELGFTLTRELPIREWLRPGEFAWDDEGVPAGPLTIVVNIRGRVLSAYRAGAEIGRSSLIYGADDKPTPHGEFRILEKDADHKSSLYYSAPMPYALRLTGDGVFLHASQMADDLATHGCVGLPKDFARLLFRAAKVGDRVFIWSGTRQG
jgi:lipoprotein-anchoring transpeptidase ErfK/SrfK